jgi:AcrR family transcriptional regulator
VAPEIIAKGFARVDLKQVATAGGLDPKDVQRSYGDREKLIAALIQEIGEAHKEAFRESSAEMGDPGERLIQFFMASFEFIDANPGLAQVIAIALYGSNPRLKEQVYETYERLFSLTLEDMSAAEVIPDQSPLLLSDLTEILLSVVFMGGSPRLQMEYVSFVDPRNVAKAVLKALRARYQARRHESLLQ